MVVYIVFPQLGPNGVFIVWEGVTPDKKLSNHVSTTSPRVNILSQENKELNYVGATSFLSS